ncbi:MAG: class I SAM-dependent methyltransferase [Ignavibacteriales bacterium]
MVQKAYNEWSATYDSDINLTRDLDHVATVNSLKGLPSQRILEIGCGTGKNTAYLAQICEKMLALDFSEGMLAIARKKLNMNNLAFVLADITRPWPCRDQDMDLIISNLVLEHVEYLPFVFSEAYRSLKAGGSFFVCELHPFRQYQGKKARFQADEETIEIQAYIHHISSFIDAAKDTGFKLRELKEWWHEKDEDTAAPRLISFIFGK